jgi:LysM repeat protein
VNLSVGETQAIQVWFDNPQQVSSIEVHLSFDPAYIRIEDSAPEVDGDQVALGTVPQPSQVVQREVNNQTGVVLYQVAQDAGDPAEASGCVTWFRVEALAEGGSPLRFTIVDLHAPDGETLPAPGQVDGLVIVGPGAGGEGSSEGVVATQPAVEPTSLPASGQVYHTVQAGENLFRIALEYGTTVEAIVEANSLPDAGSIRVGQQLRIPAAAAGGPQGEQTYTVQAGDTLYSIARRFGMKVEDLAALNGLSTPYTIQVGQTLKIVR